MRREPSLLIDNSAWARLAGPRPPGAGARQVASLIRARRLVASLPLLLEAGYSARSAGDHMGLLDQLRALPFASIDRTTELAAIEVQRQLARSGHHRLPPVDLLIAALADQHGHGVLHCDRHYDLILERTTLRFTSVWLEGA